jgi:hypothetical protein
MPTYERPTKQIGLRVPPQLLGWLTAVAKAEDRSVPYVIKRILADEMLRQEMTRERKASPRKPRSRP